MRAADFPNDSGKPLTRRNAIEMDGGIRGYDSPQRTSAEDETPVQTGMRPLAGRTLVDENMDGPFAEPGFSMVL